MLAPKLQMMLLNRKPHVARVITSWAEQTVRGSFACSRFWDGTNYGVSVINQLQEKGFVGVLLFN